jgi:putative transposase
MLAALEACRRLWNDALAHRKRRWEEERKHTSYNLQQWILTAVRDSDPKLQRVYSQAAQDVLHRLDDAFQAFFEHRSRYPKFKKHREYGSFTYPQADNGSVKPVILRKRLYLSKIGNVRAVFHRELPKEAMLKTCVVRREPDGKWFASLVYEEVIPFQDVIVPESWKAPVGIDLGLRALVTTSDGERVEPPKFLRRTERRLKRLQRGLSRKKEGSKNRWRARKRVASLHTKVARQRADFNQKLSHRLVSRHDLIVFEDLEVKNMVKNHHLAKSISDAGWGQLVAFTEYKTEREGKVCTTVPAPYTTQECFVCGAINDIGRDVREFVCVGCGKTLDRDVNAARVVLARRIAKVGQDKAVRLRSGGESHHQAVPELKPVETGPLPKGTTPAASPVVEAGTIRGGGAHTQETHHWKPRSFSLGRMSQRGREG